MQMPVLLSPKSAIWVACAFWAATWTLLFMHQDATIDQPKHSTQWVHMFWTRLLKNTIAILSVKRPLVAEIRNKLVISHVFVSY